MSSSALEVEVQSLFLKDRGEIFIHQKEFLWLLETGHNSE